MAPDRIPFEIWAAVLATVDDSATLTVCARVSSTFWAAAVPWLYREIRVLHPDRGAAIRGNRAFDAVEAHPRLRAYVRSVYHDVMDMVIWRPYMRVAYNDDRWAHATPWTSFLPCSIRVCARWHCWALRCRRLQTSKGCIFGLRRDCN
ncbi:hypothetical protein FA95DRAFT_168418 [Auriscalpium vulgare]|uniref:Uncharacterized protein n=1 Tax=Auriscalpium vulgare TaxID=40419 RepID=A0ACB8RMF9_9AGAM|nr:hypothetical protein FA95DRAFT_168418 [Auriscalpium vulgare]